MKIKHIETIGELLLERFFVSDYEKLKEKYNLPSLEVLSEISDFDEMWIFREDFEIIIYLKNKITLHYRFKSGFAYDLASTPIGRNNIQQGEYAVPVHDVNFSMRYLADFAKHEDRGFRATNKLFLNMMYYAIAKETRAELKTVSKWRDKMRIKWESYKKRRQARVWYVAVNSTVGRAFYANNRRTWHGETSSFEWAKPEKGQK